MFSSTCYKYVVETQNTALASRIGEDLLPSFFVHTALSIGYFAVSFFSMIETAVSLMAFYPVAMVSVSRNDPILSFFTMNILIAFLTHCIATGTIFMNWVECPPWAGEDSDSVYLYAGIWKERIETISLQIADAIGV